ncbi:MAG: hypothetical protein N0A24_09935 [Armatimonadetes bacterium]|nr:hypothetical protein [Armatimonadota bacterium]MDW8154497.1 hypothetical protein [Armatimonadota bacterium]
MRFLRRALGWAIRGLDAGAQYLGLPVRWKDLQESAGGLFGLLRLGPWGILAFALLTGTLGGFAAVLSVSTPERSRLLGTSLALVMLGAIVAFAFALFLSEIRGLHPVLRFAGGMYALWYLLLPPVLALPRWGALLPAWTLYAIEVGRLAADRRSPLWLVPWVLLLGRLSPVLVEPLWASVAAWAMVYGFLGLVLFRVARSDLPAPRAVLFWSMAAVYAWGIVQSPARFGEALRMGYDALFMFLGLFWMWLAADLVDDASEVAERAVRRLRGAFQHRAVVCGIACGLLGIGGMGILVTVMPAAVLDAVPQAAAVPLMVLLRDQWHEGTLLCGLLLAATGAVTLWRAWRREDPVSAASDAVASAVVVGLVYLGARQAWSALSEVQAPEGWWPLLLASVPVVVEELKQTSKGVRESSAALLTGGVALLGIAATAFRFAQEPPAALRTTTLYPFLGMVLWGLPHLVARLGAGWQAEIRSTAFFLTGYLTALPAALLLPHLRTGSPALAVLLWPWALRAARLRLPPASGGQVAAGLLLASGTLAFYYEPLFLPVPFVPWTQAVLQRLGEVRATEMLDWTQLVAWTGAALSGVTFGLGGRRATWVAAAVLWAGWNLLLLR